MRPRSALLAGILLALVLNLSGCSKDTKVTPENFNKITDDMSLEQIEAILGKGEMIDDPAKDVNALMGLSRAVPKVHEGEPVKTVKWQSGEKVVYVHFVGEKCKKMYTKMATFP